MSRVRVKICGVTTTEGVRAAVAAGADAIGLNFYPESPRCVTVERASELAAAADPFVSLVGVFVGTPAAEMRAIAQRVGLRAVQVLADGPPPDVRPVARIDAFRVGDGDDVTRMVEWLERCRDNAPAAVLVDAKADGALGGTGHVAPWALLSGLRVGVPLILAGGLTPANVAAAVETVRPAAVDVASGVEDAPGIKSAAKMAAFVTAMANVERRSAGASLNGIRGREDV